MALDDRHAAGMSKSIVELNTCAIIDLMSRINLVPVVE